MIIGLGWKVFVISILAAIGLTFILRASGYNALVCTTRYSNQAETGE